MSAGRKKWKKPKIKHNKLTKWNWMVSYPKNLHMGYRVDIGAFTYIQAQYYVSLGHMVQIGGGCKIYSYNSINNVKGPVIIRNWAKIGANSVILPNVVIEKDETIPACSVVYMKDGKRCMK